MKKVKILYAFVFHLLLIYGAYGQSSTNTGVDSGTQGNHNSFFGYKSGQLTTTDGNSFFGSNSGAKNTTGLYNTFIGNNAGYNNTSASNNLFLGSFAGYNNNNGNFNVFIGPNSGFSNTSASNNIFLGYHSGNKNTTGKDNLFLGSSSGKNNTTGNYNTFMGRNSGVNNTTASYNMFMGGSSGASTTTGAHNMFLGYYSGNKNTTGLGNVYIGSLAGRNNISGSKNVFIGPSAGLNNTGSSNIFIGHSAGQNETTSDKLYIENSSGDIPLVYGDFSSDQIGINTKIIAQGTTLAVAGRTQIDGTLYSKHATFEANDIAAAAAAAANDYQIINLNSVAFSAGRKLGTYSNGFEERLLHFFDFPNEVRLTIEDHNNKGRLRIGAKTGQDSYLTMLDKDQSEYFKVFEATDGTKILQMEKSNSRLRIGALGDYLPEQAVVVKGNSMFEGNLKSNRTLLLGTAEFEAFGNNGKHYMINSEGGPVKFSDDMNPAIGLKSSNPTVGSWLDIALATFDGSYSKFAKKGSVVMRGVSYKGDFLITNPGNTGITFATGSWDTQAERMTITNTGNVGIGTMTPDANYKLSVNGKVRAKEVTVETGWSDYVFYEDYNLPTLKEVEQHIEEKGHLINIPSAKEVEEKGIKLGEINAKLLEKIEELTLYTIAQEKKLQEQEERLQKLEALINKQ